MSEDRTHERVAKMIEQERLGDFQKEIESLRDADAGKDLNLAGVKDVSELEVEDLKSWEIYRRILDRIDNLENAQEIKIDCDRLAEENNFSIAQATKNSGKKSRAYFIGWLGNLNPLAGISSVIDGLATMEEIKEDLKKYIEKYK